VNDSTMEVSEILKAGTVVEIGILTRGGGIVGSYPGYIRQPTKHEHIDIGLPTLIEQECPLIKGHLVKIKITALDGVYSFQEKVLERKEGFFAVGRPAQLELLQRREYARVSTGVPVVFQVKGEPSVCKGYTINLSGGGTLMRSDSEINVSDQLELQFILPGGVLGNSIFGEVKRRMVIHLPTGEGRSYLYGVSFVQISDDERETILTYLSETICTTP
jgi:c-di-GMP-binding flagellar brake protein YcgR